MNPGETVITMKIELLGRIVAPWPFERERVEQRIFHVVQKIVEMIEEHSLPDDGWHGVAAFFRMLGRDFCPKFPQLREALGVVIAMCTIFEGVMCVEGPSSASFSQ